jgi:hypothetical protein
MGKRFCKIIVACCLLFLHGLTYGQEQPKNSPPVSIAIASAIRPAFNQKTKGGLGQISEPKPIVTVLPLSYSLPRLIAPDSYTRQFGFFCKKELQIQKSTGIPLRFRLGSLTYSNALEGK